MGRFPDCFPVDFATKILPANAGYTRHHVYRVVKSGRIDRQAFESSYEENLRQARFRRPRPLRKDDPSTYSTSCCVDYEQAAFLKKVTFRDPPEAIIAEGITEPICGPTLKNQASGHVDWWIYKDAKPECYFKEVPQNGSK